ncbi:hypothetical protein RUM44_009210, partial [Polyplax serrata]
IIPLHVLPDLPMDHSISGGIPDSATEIFLEDHYFVKVVLIEDGQTDNDNSFSSIKLCPKFWEHLLLSIQHSCHQLEADGLRQ